MLGLQQIAGNKNYPMEDKPNARTNEEQRYCRDGCAALAAGEDNSSAC